MGWDRRFSIGLAAAAVACGSGRGDGGDGGESGSASLSASSSTSASGSGEGTADAASTAVDGSSGSGGSVGSASEGAKFDVAAIPDSGSGGCGGVGGRLDFSYIWIANTAQGTITKLDTQTMVELGRYITRPDGVGSPSRTSVSLSGDVAVANRSGGLTKVYARVENCGESNGMPGIQTSSGKTDILAWGSEECVAWHTPMAYTTQRPVAWTAGTLDRGSCTWQDQKVWTAGADNFAPTGIDAVLVDGDTGVIEATVNVPEVAVSYYGAYGGAVDGEGDFWFMTYVSGSPLVEVDLETLDYQIVMMPPETHPYGITIDHEGRVWFGADIGQSARYDPGDGTWAFAAVTGLGIQEHPDGYMWMGTFPTTGIQAIDVETLALGPFIPLASPSQTKGVSIDFYGYVWLVDMTNSAWRIDPDTLAYDVYTGLDSPYTYSDMTGWGLSNVVGPQG